MIDISKVQDDVVGDGTTSVVVLAAELLRVRVLLYFIGIGVMEVHIFQLICDVQNNISRELYK